MSVFMPAVLAMTGGVAAPAAAAIRSAHNQALLQALLVPGSVIPYTAGPRQPPPHFLTPGRRRCAYCRGLTEAPKCPNCGASQ